VDRGSYENLPVLLVTAMAIGFFAPLAAILLFGRRIDGNNTSKTRQ
jgi:hypothetical protein